MDSARKKKISWAILTAVPVAVLIIAEVSLRFAGYGGNPALIIKKNIYGKEYYSLDPAIAKRYTPSRDSVVPELNGDLFAVRKPADTKRIFMLGESTIAGFPYEYTATPSSLLRNRLRECLPQYEFEVVNAGMSGINSYTVVDFARELRDYQPDAYIVYLGHNEFYDALGVGPAEFLGENRILVRLSLTLQKSRVYLLLRDAIVELRSMFSQQSRRPSQEARMEAMAALKPIPFHSEEYEQTRENFAANLREIVEIARDARIPIVLTTLTSNIHDQRPLEPVFSSSTTADQRRIIASLLERAKLAVAGGSPGQALDLCEQAIAIDSFFAPSHVTAARALEALDRTDEAKAHYRRARDYDGLRFRASTDFNDVIRSIASGAPIALADADSAFDASSPSGITGNTLILEHLHPSFDGYLLLAKLYAQTLRGHSILAPAKRWVTNDSLTDAHFRETARVTSFDLQAGAYRIEALTSRWPFAPTDQPAAFPPPADMVQETALRFVRGQGNWSDAHYSLGDRFLAQNNLPAALREYQAVAQAQPYYYYPIMLIGDAYRSAKDDSAAFAWYSRGLKLRDSPLLHARLATLHYEQNRLDDAIREFHLAFASEENGEEQFHRKDQALAYYFLGVTFGKKGDLAQARSNLRLAEQIDPQNRDIREMINQLHAK